MSGIPLADVDVTVEEYISFAREDLARNSKQGNINALSNAKRAMHLMVDSLLNAYGLLALNKRLSFPSKLKLLDGVGLFSLSILQTLNVERNVVEHEYRVPTSSRVLEMIDVAHLLYLATQRMSEYVAYECLAGWRADRSHGLVQLNPTIGRLAFFKVDGPTATFEHDNHSYIILHSVRTANGDLVQGVTVDDSPSWAHHLRLGNMTEWAPLVKPLIDLNLNTRSISSPVTFDGVVQIAMRITMPAEFDGQASVVDKPLLSYTPRLPDFL